MDILEQVKQTKDEELAMELAELIEQRKKSAKREAALKAYFEDKGIQGDRLFGGVMVSVSSGTRTVFSAEKAREILSEAMVEKCQDTQNFTTVTARKLVATH